MIFMSVKIEKFEITDLYGLNGGHPIFKTVSISDEEYFTRKYYDTTPTVSMDRILEAYDEYIKTKNYR